VLLSFTNAFYDGRRNLFIFVYTSLEESTTLACFRIHSLALSLIFALLCGLVTADQLHKLQKAQVCGGQVTEIRGNCGSEPCTYKRGSNFEVEVDFVAPADSNTLTADVSAIIGGLRVPWPGFNKNACTGNGLSCPLKAGQKYTYRYSGEIKQQYPKANLKFEWKLRDSSNNMLFCFGTQLKLE